MKEYLSVEELGIYKNWPQDQCDHSFEQRPDCTLWMTLIGKSHYCTKCGKLGEGYDPFGGY